MQEVGDAYLSNYSIIKIWPPSKRLTGPLSYKNEFKMYQKQQLFDHTDTHTHTHTPTHTQHIHIRCGMKLPRLWAPLAI
jgi:hypothetical protein